MRAGSRPADAVREVQRVGDAAAHDVDAALEQIVGAKQAHTDVLGHVVAEEHNVALPPEVGGRLVAAAASIRNDCGF